MESPRAAVAEAVNEEPPIVLYYGYRNQPNGKGQTFDSFVEQFHEDFSKDEIMQPDGTMLCQLTCRFCHIRIGARGDLLRNHIKCFSHGTNKSLAIATCPPLTAAVTEVNEEKEDEEGSTATGQIEEKTENVTIALEEQIAKERQIRLILKDVKESLVTCKICLSVFLSSSELRDHEKKSHNKYKCSQCRFEGESGEEYRIHLSLHKYFNPCVCEECGQSYINQTCLRMHSVKKHPELLIPSKPNVQNQSQKTEATATTSSHSVPIANANAHGNFISSSLAELKLDVLQNVIPDPALALQQQQSDRDQKSLPEKILENSSLSPDPHVAISQKENLRDPSAVVAQSQSKPLEVVNPENVSRPNKRNYCVICKKYFKTRSAFLVHFMFTHAANGVKRKGHLKKSKKKKAKKSKKKTKTSLSSKVKIKTKVNAEAKAEAGTSEPEITALESETMDEVLDENGEPMFVPVVTLLDDENESQITPTADIPKSNSTITIMTKEKESSSTSKRSTSIRTPSIIRDLRSRVVENKGKLTPKPKPKPKPKPRTPIVRLQNIGIAKNAKKASKKCLICHKSVHLDDLKEHIDAHVSAIPQLKGQRTCSLCSKISYVKIQRMREHMYTVHFDVRPYKCDFCPKTYALQPSIREHLVTVHRTCKELECKKCGQCFTKKDRLAAHGKNAHGQGSGSKK